MDGFQFEYRCAELLRNRGFHKVSVTKSIGDQGIDVIAYKNGEKYGIQCKYYSHTVGNKAVQEAYSGAGFYDCDHAVVMTNSTFSRAARELAAKLDVELIDGCPSNDISSALYRIMKLINIICILFCCFITGSVQLFQFPSLSPFFAGCLLSDLVAAFLGIFGWRYLISTILSFLFYLLPALCLITWGIFYRNIQPFWLCSLLPSLLSFVHFILLRRDKDLSDEKRPLHRKEKRKIARLGRLYADALSSSLHVTVTYQHGSRTEEGYLFLYASPCQDEYAVRKAVCNFGKTFHSFYEVQLTESGFSVLQHLQNSESKRREEPPA